MPFVVGLTGGIGSGKSAAAARFAMQGAAIVDTDVIAHDLTGPDGVALPALCATFGTTVLSADGALDRPAMRALAFADPAARLRLEAILHPLIRTESMRRIAIHDDAPYVILVVPLLVESGAYRDRIDRIAVVDCDDETRLRRVMARSGLERDEILRIMTAQASRAQRLAVADDIIDNGGTLAHLHAQIDGSPDGLDALYRDLAAKKPATD